MVVMSVVSPFQFQRVRLKARNVSDVIKACFVFQFQRVRLKDATKGVTLLLILLFQFQRVRLKGEALAKDL